MLEAVVKFFRRSMSPSATLTGKEHDFKKNGWGHALSVDDTLSWDDKRGARVSFHGHCYGLHVGDVYLQPLKSGKVGKWRIDKIRYCSDPRDMFFGESTCLEYVEEA